MIPYVNISGGVQIFVLAKSGNYFWIKGLLATVQCIDLMKAAKRRKKIQLNDEKSS